MKNAGIDVSHETVTMAINSGPDPSPARSSDEPGWGAWLQPWMMLAWT